MAGHYFHHHLLLHRRPWPFFAGMPAKPGVSIIVALTQRRYADRKYCPVIL
jgi:hypothetical protein